MGLIQSILLGLCGGLVNTIRNDYHSFVQCMFSCDSWMLKVEKCLSYVGFIMGASGPGEVVFLWADALINQISITHFGVTFQNNPVLVNGVAFIMANFGQTQLNEIWGTVRQQSLCLMFDNCHVSSLKKLSGWKKWYCNVTEERGYFYVARKQSTCEKVFNEVPLMVLCLGMCALFIIAKFMKPYVQARRDGMRVIDRENYNDTALNLANSDDVGYPGDNSSDPPISPEINDDLPNVPNDADNSEPEGPAVPPPTPPPPDPFPSDLPSPTTPPQRGSDGGGDGGGGGDTQPVNTICTICKELTTIHVINPTPVFCCPGCKEGGSAAGCKTCEKMVAEAVTKYLSEVMVEMQKCLCDQCVERISKCLEGIGWSGDCGDCGFRHPPD